MINLSHDPTRFRPANQTPVYVSQARNGGQEYDRRLLLVLMMIEEDRNPDDAPESTRDYRGYNFWLDKLNNFNGNFVAADMVKAFLISGEYRQRFGP